MSHVPDHLIDRAAQLTAAAFEKEAERLGTRDIVFMVTFKNEGDDPRVQVFPRAEWLKVTNPKFRASISHPVTDGYYLAVVAPSGHLQLVHAHTEPIN